MSSMRQDDDSHSYSRLGKGAKAEAEAEAETLPGEFPGEVVLKKEEEEGEEVDPRDEFGLEDQDETGRYMAYASFKKIETSIIDSYELLSNPEDQELFYDYLIANAKLYFDKFEGELSPDVSEPTNQAYDMAKGEQGGAAGGEEMSIDL